MHYSISLFCFRFVFTEEGGRGSLYEKGLLWQKASPSSSPLPPLPLLSPPPPLPLETLLTPQALKSKLFWIRWDKDKIFPDFGRCTDLENDKQTNKNKDDVWWGFCACVCLFFFLSFKEKSHPLGLLRGELSASVPVRGVLSSIQ